MMTLVIFLYGLLVGSFLNVVIFRLGTKKSIWFGRSQCPQCNAKIAWYDNIPVLSYLLLAGQCRACQKKISIQYILVELITAVLFCWLYLLFGWSEKFLIYSVLVGLLEVIFVYDLRHYLILDQVALPGIIMALLASLYLGLPWYNLLIGMAAGAGFFAVQFFITGVNFSFFKNKTNIFDINNVGQWVGGGDIRLGALMGAMLGWQLLLVALLISYVVGATVGVALMALGQKKMSSQIPFGPFLTLATLITLLYGNKILSWYLSSLGL